MSINPKEEFIAEVTKGLNAEQEVIVRHELDDKLDSHHPNLALAAERLSEKQSSKHAYGRWVLIFLLLFSVIAICLSRSTNPVSVWKSYKYYKGILDPFSYSPDRVKIRLDPDETRLLEAPTEMSHAYELWQSDPNNLSFFVNYVNLSINGGADPIPENLLTIAKEIDPDNSLYLMIEAALLHRSIKTDFAFHRAKDRLSALEEKHQKAGYKNENEINEIASLKVSLETLNQFQIIDQQKFENAVEILRLAISKPNFKRHFKELSQLRTQLLLSKIEPDDILKRAQYFSYQDSLGPSLVIRRSNDIFCAHLERLSVKGDPEEVKWWIDSYIDYLNDSLSDTSTLIQCLIINSEMRSSVQRMQLAAQRIGSKKLRAKLGLLNASLEKAEALKEARIENFRPNVKTSVFFQAFQFISQQSSDIIPLTNENLAPDRYAEHALLGRFLCIALWIFLGLIISITWFYRFLRNTQIGQTSMRMCDCIRAKDWLIILSISILLPITFFWLLTHHTTISHRESNIATSNFIPSIGSYLTMFLMMTSLSVWTVRWRLASILPVEMKRFKILHTVAVAMSFIGLILLGVYTRENAVPHFVIGIVLLPLLYWIITGIRFFFGKVSIERYLINRTLIPVFAVGAISLAVMVMSLYQVEKYWVAQDALSSIDTDSGYTNYEAMITELKKKELQKQLNLLK